jgi:transcriptional regulator with XRE-family HTH domain
MPSARYLTDDEKVAIREARIEEKLNYHELAAKFGRSVSTIARLLNNQPPGGRPKVHKGPSAAAKARDKRHQRILKLRARGLSYGQIAAKVGTNSSNVGYYLKKRAHMNGAAPIKRTQRRIQPIVLGAETVAQADERLMSRTLDLLWARMSYDEKLQAVGALQKEES